MQPNLSNLSKSIILKSAPNSIMIWYAYAQLHSMVLTNL